MLLFVVEQVLLPMREVCSMPNIDITYRAERRIFMFKLSLSCHKTGILPHKTTLDSVCVCETSEGPAQGPCLEAVFPSEHIAVTRSICLRGRAVEDKCCHCFLTTRRQTH